MTWTDRLDLFSQLDALAVATILVLWIATGWLIEHPPKSRPSVSYLMRGYRQEWMRQMVLRDPRIFDSQVLGSLRQGTAFFASAALLAIGGGLALIGNVEQLRGVVRDLTQETDPAIVWEIKLMLVLLFAVNAFLKFVWSNRLFGYCAVLMAAVPNSPEDPAAMPRAKKAGTLNITAARSFNRGLRSVYFAMAAAAWILGPAALILAALFTTGVLWRREFASQSRLALLAPEDGMPHTDS